MDTTNFDEAAEYSARLAEVTAQRDEQSREADRLARKCDRMEEKLNAALNHRTALLSAARAMLGVRFEPVTAAGGERGSAAMAWLPEWNMLRGTCDMADDEATIFLGFAAESVITQRDALLAALEGLLTIQGYAEYGCDEQGDDETKHVVPLFDRARAAIAAAKGDA